MSGPLAALRGDSPRIVAIRHQVAQLLARQAGARRLPPLLIVGETGTGKGVLARAIHQAGPRRAGPFMDINCAAIPETLLEAELFGFERGAFTDARQAKAGLFQAAHGGTLFLDEVGLLPAALQGKLLTVLESRAVRRLGSTRTETVDIAVLAATSVNLRGAVSEGRFREDLYHRLAVITLELPPLRSRGADVIALAEHFLARACEDYGLSPRALGAEARAVLAGYSWPGNVRELANAMERVALLSDSDEITPAMLQFPSEPGASTGSVAQMAAASILTAGSLDDAQRARIESALRENGGKIRRTALALGISRNTLRARMNKYGLQRHHASPAAARPRTASAWPPPPRWERRALSFLRVKLCPQSALNLSKALEVVSEKVLTFAGRIEEVSPFDAIAVFGLEPVDNATSHAALAALAIQNAIVRAQAGGGVAQVNIAIHCADHLVSTPEASVRIGLDGKAATWSTLDRLVLTEEPSAIAVSSAAAPFLKRRFSLEPPGERRDAWRLVGRHEALGAWGTTGFVGRHSELDTLRLLAGRVEQGQGQIAGLVGEAGIGKSRLLHEAVRSLLGWRVLAAGGAPYARNTPYFPLQELLRAYCQVLDTDAPAAAREKILGTLLPGAGDPAAIGPAILDLLGLLPATDEFSGLDGPLRRQRTHEAIKQVLLVASVARPLCLIVEDLHWIDAESQMVLDRLVNAIPSFRVLLLVSYRPGYQHAWGSRSYYTQVRLDPLPTDSAKALLSDLLGEHESLKPAVQLLVDRSGGNPLFLEEHVRTLVETSALVGERGAYRLAAEVTMVDAAPTVQAIIGARIARLASEDRRVLQAAAVVGQDVPVPLLQAIANLTGTALTQALERLQAAEFICETRLGSDVGHAFRHALIHEVVYASLLEEPRRLLHQRALDALERTLGDRRTERIEVLARHARCGEVWPQAAQYLYGAGEKALARAAYRIAGEFFAGAIEALERQGEGADLALKLDAYAERWVTTVETGSASFEEHRHIAEEVIRQAERLGDSRRLVRARLQHAQFLWARGEAREGGGLERALEEAREAFRLAPAEDLRTRSYARLLAGATCHDLGRLGEALEEFDAGAALFDTEPSSDPDGLARPILANLWSWRAETLADLGHLQRAVESAEAAASAAAQGGHSASMLVAESFLGHVHLMRGDAETALPHLERALALAEEHGVRHALVANRHSLAHALALLGRPWDGLHQLARASEVEHGPSVGIQWAKYRTVAASAYLTAGQLDQAGHEAETGYSLAVAHGARAYLPALLRLRAEIALARGRRLEEAAQSLDTGLVIAEEVGLRAEEARLRLARAMLMKRRGDPARAGTELERARELLAATDMARWLES